MPYGAQSNNYFILWSMQTMQSVYKNLINLMDDDSIIFAQLNCTKSTKFSMDKYHASWTEIVQPLFPDMGGVTFVWMSFLDSTVVQL